MRFGGLAVFLAAMLNPSSARPQGLKLAVIFDSTLRASWEASSLRSDVRATIDAMQAVLQKKTSSLDVAIVDCTRDDSRSRAALRVYKPFGSGIGHLSDQLDQIARTEVGCPASIDGVDLAVEGLDWGGPWNKRILVVRFDDGRFAQGRTSIEEVVHRAELSGIVVHAIEFSYLGWSTGIESSVQELDSDLAHFLDRPTESMGRVPAVPRHATSISGGTYHLLCPLERVSYYDHVKRARHSLKEIRSAYAGAFGPRSGGRDALDDLADGLRRPSEVKRDEVPKPLAGINLEPLLDAVWDFVDARRVESEILEQTLTSDVLGARVADEMLASRRRMPSRR
jgi:hypothetical protein